MDLHFIAQWLDTFCHPFDHALLEFYHGLAEVGGVVLTPLCEALAFLGDNGLLSFLLGFILLAFKKTRKAGACVIGAVLFGAVITNLTLKEAVERLRPYASGNTDFAAWWQFIGAPTESEFSFPSGHTTAAMAAAASVCLNFKKIKFIIPAIAYAIIMGASRNYLMVHYPTDVIAGIIAGTVGALIAFLLVKFAFGFAQKRKDNKFFSFLLDFDVKDLFKKKNHSENT